MLDRSDLFDPELVSRLTRRGLSGPPSPYPHRGIHRSPRRGASLEFSEHTEYTPGDDLRHLDWKVYAKSDRFFVKRYEDERLQRAVLLVDASGSMQYGAELRGLRGSKYHLAARVAVALAACLLRQGDAVGLQVAGGEEWAYLPVRAGSAQLESVIEILGEVTPGGVAGFTEGCKALGERLRRAASVFLISDYLDEEEEELAGVRFLMARRISPRMIHVLHAEEVVLPFENTSKFVDLEGPGNLVIDPLPIRRAYTEEIHAFVRQMARQADLLGVPYAFFTSADDPGPVLGRLLHNLGRG